VRSAALCGHVPRMVQPRVLVFVLAGGAGSRLELLTQARAKPAVAYGGHYRLVDVVLSNCRHSGLDEVWLTQQTNPVSLSDHLNGGRPWDLDRSRGGLLVLAPRQDKDTGKGGFARGTADVLWRHTELIRAFDPEALVVLSSDAVYAMDYEEVVREHLASDADLTMVTTRVAPHDAARYGVVQVDGERITHYAYKPDEPASDVVTNEVFVFTPGPVLDLLDELGEAAGQEGLRDLGDDVLPRMVDSGRARSHPFDGYWRDLGTVDAYWHAHMDLLEDQPPFDPGDPAWPLLTRGGARRAARVRAGAELDGAALSPGSEVAGRVRRSVLSPGVLVEAGAEVEDSVLLHDVVVRAGATVRRAVLDEGVEVAAGCTVGGDGELVLVGRGEQVTTDLAPGARQPEVQD
jgi:glucose-1-phosphate adenylyltransferase